MKIPNPKYANRKSKIDLINEVSKFGSFGSIWDKLIIILIMASILIILMVK